MFDPSILPYKFGWFSWEWGKNYFFFSKKKFKMADSKKAHFSKSPILKNFLRKFQRLVLGIVGLIDAKAINVALPKWSQGCPAERQKQVKNAFFVFLGCFCPYVGQPHHHIGWAMPFASTNPTNPKTNPWIFHKEILRIGDFEKWAFFESAILNFFFQKKKKKWLHSHENQPKFIW